MKPTVATQWVFLMNEMKYSYCLSIFSGCLARSTSPNTLEPFQQGETTLDSITENLTLDLGELDSKNHYFGVLGFGRFPVWTVSTDSFPLRKTFKVASFPGPICAI